MDRIARPARYILPIATAAALVLSTAATATPPASTAGAAPAAAASATTGRLTTSDGVALAYDVAGSGAPAVFVHGGPGSGSHAFRLLSNGALEKHFRVAWLDQRGSGASASAPTGDYSLDRQVADLEELRAGLGHERWTLVAYSFGGLIAQAYAKAHPERVAGIVHVDSLLNLPASMKSSAAHGLGLLPADKRPPVDPAMPLPQRYFMVLGTLGQAGLSDRLQYADEAAAARAKAMLAANPAPARNGEMAQRIFAGDPGRYIEDMTAATADVDVPVLVVTGDADHVTGPGHYRTFRYPKQTVAVLKGGHMAFYEDADGFARALAAFASRIR
ncbi:MAG TPA: alpha/beta hydrolase [Lysobacter sp.]|nr:alpha/beta hydrolase [Lysobacter sp.]